MNMLDTLVQLMGISTVLDKILDTVRDSVISILESGIRSGQELVWSALSPLSPGGKFGVILGIGALTLGALKAYRQGYEGRVGQPMALLGFASVLLIILDFLPPAVVQLVLVFGAIAAVGSVINLSSYFRQETESTEWYDLNRWGIGSIPLLVILLLLILAYIVGVDLPLLP